MSTETKHLMKCVAAVMLIGILMVIIFYSYADKNTITSFLESL